jgi:hypothetical protein
VKLLNISRIAPPLAAEHRMNEVEVQVTVQQSHRNAAPSAPTDARRSEKAHKVSCRFAWESNEGKAESPEKIPDSKVVSECGCV